MADESFLTEGDHSHSGLTLLWPLRSSYVHQGKRILLRFQCCISPSSSIVTGVEFLFSTHQQWYHDDENYVWHHSNSRSQRAHHVRGTIWILNHNSMEKLLWVLLFYRHKNLGGEVNLPKMTKIGTGRARVQAQAGWTPKAYTYALNHSAPLPHEDPRLCPQSLETQLFSLL